MSVFKRQSPHRPQGNEAAEGRGIARRAKSMIGKPFLVLRLFAPVLGGHFPDGIVHPTLEATIVEAPAHLYRRHQHDLGIGLIAP